MNNERITVNDLENNGYIKKRASGLLFNMCLGGHYEMERF